MAQQNLLEFLKKNRPQETMLPEATLSRVPGLSGISAPPPISFTPTADAQPMAPNQQAYPFGPVGAPQGSPSPSMLDRASRGFNNFLGTSMRAFTPQEDLGYTPPTMGDVAASAGIRAQGGGILGEPNRTTARFGPTGQIDEPMMGTEQAGQGSTQALPSPTEQASAQAQPSIPMGEAGSPQANFANFMQGGGQLSPEQIAQANQFAASMGTTFNPETGYDRQPFLASQGANPPMGQEATRARIGELFGTGGSPTLNQAITGQEGAVMGTDPQGRMRSFESPEARAQAFADSQRALGDASAARQANIGGTGSFAGDSMAREARLAARDPIQGETQTQRDTRLAAARTQGGGSVRDAAGMTQGDRRNILRAQGIGGSGQVAAARQMGNQTNMDAMGGAAGAMTPQDAVDFQRSLTGLQLDQMKVEEMQQKLSALPVEQQQKFNQDVDALKQVLSDTKRINEIGTRAGQSTGLGTTGVSGWLMSMVPGSGSKDFRGDMNTLAADSAFSTLKAMKEASPTGGALGQITEKELDLLRDSQVALDPNLSDERIKANVKRYLDIRNQIMRKAYNGFVREYGKEVADNLMSGGQMNQPSQAQSTRPTVDYGGSNYEIVQ